MNMYADYNSPTTSHEDVYILMTNIEKDGRKVTNWFDRNDMYCSGEKTILMICGTRGQRQYCIEND